MTHLQSLNEAAKRGRAERRRTDVVPWTGAENGRSVNWAFMRRMLKDRRIPFALNRFAVETSSRAETTFAGFHTISSVRPPDVRGFVNFISSAVMDVTIRR